jgi:hypothetical protein
LTQSVDVARQSGIIEPQKYQERVWSPDDFQTDSNGDVIFSRASSRLEEREDLDSVQFAVSAAFLESRPKEYIDALDAFPQRVGMWRPLSDWFVHSAVEALIRDPARPCPAAEELIRQAQRLVSGEPCRFAARADFRGLRVRGGTIRIRSPVAEYELRAPRLEEVSFVERFPPAGPRKDFGYVHSIHAVAEISGLHRGGNSARDAIEGIQCLLRLFKPGGASYLGWEERTISPVRDFPTGLTAGVVASAPEPVVLTPTDATALQSFIDWAWEKQPRTERNGGALSIAYSRYVDSLGRDVNPVERRLASAVMGLEALYLPRASEGELSYRLRLHVARVLAELGYDSSIVTTDVREAYGIRSSYVHGYELNSTGRGRAPPARDELLGLCRRTIDYLRASIVLFMALGVNKDQFLPIVDRTLADPRPALGFSVPMSKAAPLVPR